MKFIRLFPLLMLCALVVLTGCESDVEDMDLDVSSKLVVISYISPQDTLLKVHLQMSQPAIGKRLSSEQLKIKNATVTISDGASVLALAYNADKDHYEGDAKAWPVSAGKTYRLKVITPAGDVAEATCTVPRTEGIEITEINAPYSVEQDYYNSNARKYNISFKWKDAPEVANYYRTLVYKAYSITDSDGLKRTFYEGVYRGYNGIDTQTDEKSKGGIMTSEAIVYYDYNSDRMDKPFYLYAVLVVSDRHYYLYHQSLYKQQETSDNPFSEPTIMYSNIKGGLGVFGGYNQLVAVKELE